MIEHLSPKMKRVINDLISHLDVVENESDELRSIRATLLINCREGKTLYNLGIKYQDDKSVHGNLFDILIQMNKMIEDLKNDKT